MDELRLYHILNSRLNYSEEMHESEQKVLDLIDKYSIFTKRVKGKDESPLQWAVANSSIVFLNKILENGVKPKPEKLLLRGMSFYHGSERPLKLIMVFQEHNYKITEDMATSLFLSLCQEYQSKESTNNFECIKYLLSLGADINAFGKTDDYSNALMRTLDTYSFELTKILLDLGANPNLKNKEGVTPLLLACGKPAGGGFSGPETEESIEIVKVLLTAGADTSYKMGKVQNALYWAKRSKSKETVNILLAHAEKI